MSPHTLRRVCSRSVRGLVTHARLFALLLLFFFTVSLVIGSAATPVSADTDTFTEIFRGIGNYGYVAEGIGTRGNPNTGTWTGAGDITLSIPDSATIVKAHLSWTGRTNAYDADGVMLAVDNGPATNVQADVQLAQDPWCCQAQQRREVSDVTDLIQPGTHVYNITDHEHSFSPTGNFLNYGVGIWVVYEDDGEEWGETVVYEGQDSFFRLWLPPIGPHSEVRCFEFEPSDTDRLVEMTHFVSGVDTQVDVRSNAFWYTSGSGAPPVLSVTPGLIGQPGASGYQSPGQYPFQSYKQLEWDDFEPETKIPVNAGDTWLCFQIESGDSQNLAELNNVGMPASGMWGMFAVKLPLQAPTAVSLTAFDVQSIWGHEVTLRWETAAEQDHFGFNLYRSTSDQFAAAQKVHFEPAAAAGGAANGAVYTFTDGVPAPGTYWYWLESIDTSGVTKQEDVAQAAVSGNYTLYLPLMTK